MQSIGPELKRAIARGILRTTLEREPTALELSAALKAALHESDPGRFVEAVMRHTPRQTPPVLLELARSAVMMEAELATIRGSLSWRMAGMMRSAGRKLPPSARLGLRDAVIRLYRGTRAGTRLVRSMVFDSRQLSTRRVAQSITATKQEAPAHRNIRDVRTPNLVRPIDHHIAQKIRIDLMLGMRNGRARPLIDRH